MIPDIPIYPEPASSYIMIPLVVKGQNYFNFSYPYKLALPFRTDKDSFKKNLNSLLQNLNQRVSKEYDTLPAQNMTALLCDDSFSSIKVCCVCSTPGNPQRCKKANCLLEQEDFVEIFRSYKNLKLEITLNQFFSYSWPKRYLTFEKVDFDTSKIRTENKDHLNYLHTIVQNHIQDEIMSDENSWFCNKCNRDRKAKKIQNFVHMPELLTIHFKRFKYNGNRFVKIDKFIEYPLVLGQQFFVRKDDMVDLSKSRQQFPPKGTPSAKKKVGGSKMDIEFDDSVENGQKGNSANEYGKNLIQINESSGSKRVNGDN